jgi:hypothetical protein
MLYLHLMKVEGDGDNENDNKRKEKGNKYFLLFISRRCPYRDCIVEDHEVGFPV